MPAIEVTRILPLLITSTYSMKQAHSHFHQAVCCYTSLVDKHTKEVGSREHITGERDNFTIMQQGGHSLIVPTVNHRDTSINEKIRMSQLVHSFKLIYSSYIHHRPAERNYPGNIAQRFDRCILVIYQLGCQGICYREANP